MISEQLQEREVKSENAVRERTTMSKQQLVTANPENRVTAPPFDKVDKVSPCAVAHGGLTQRKRLLHAMHYRAQH